MFEDGRKQNQDLQIKECTFSPNLRVKTEKCINQEEIESFYQKNISWKNKVEKEVKLKQCEKNSEGINHLTFAPKIVTHLPSRTPSAKGKTIPRKIPSLSSKRKESRNSY